MNYDFHLISQNIFCLQFFLSVLSLSNQSYDTFSCVEWRQWRRCSDRPLQSCAWTGENRVNHFERWRQWHIGVVTDFHKNPQSWAWTSENRVNHSEPWVVGLIIVWSEDGDVLYCRCNDRPPMFWAGLGEIRVNPCEDRDEGEMTDFHFLEILLGKIRLITARNEVKRQIYNV